MRQMSELLIPAVATATVGQLAIGRQMGKIVRNTCRLAIWVSFSRIYVRSTHFVNRVAAGTPEMTLRLLI